jgi:hypothetical protein
LDALVPADPAPPAPVGCFCVGLLREQPPMPTSKRKSVEGRASDRSGDKMALLRVNSSKAARVQGNVAPARSGRRPSRIELLATPDYLP